MVFGSENRLLLKHNYKTFQMRLYFSYKKLHKYGRILGAVSKNREIEGETNGIIKKRNEILLFGYNWKSNMKKELVSFFFFF